ncbi:MAG: type VI secretion system contractile sheath small subunit [Myxococcales bacterium]|nr:type VI secretion system contractile sheath small subunit [Myxococcales bacterium]MCB9718756.1 type VI secretion system contractile sheath small subunit [Myxococcales bacterium]
MSFSVDKARPLRWLVAAPFSSAPNGRTLLASGERFGNLMAKVAPAATVEIPDGLGAGSSRRVQLTFERPRDFRLSEVIKRVEVLSSLTKIAGTLADKADLDAAIRSLRAKVGDGDLVKAVERIAAGEAAEPPPRPAAPAPTQSSAPASEPEPSAGGSAIDAIFSKAAVAPTPAQADASTVAKSGLDAFIGAMRKSRGTTPVPSKSSSAASRARDAARLIRQAAEAAALDLLAAPPVARLEAGWRGFRMVVSSAPGADELLVEMMDTSEERLLGDLQNRLSAEPMDRPDAVMVAIPIPSLDGLRSLAALAQRSLVPIVVEVPDAVTGAWLDDRSDLPPVPDAWAELQADPAAAWLGAVSNAVVLANEEADGTRRIVFGSPVWGLASMLSASVGQTGGPGQIFGRAGALVAPASYGLDGGQGSSSIATERMASVDRQRALAERGVLVVGSERGTDRLRLAAAPMVRSGGDDVQLPGRILAGRANRLLQAIRNELPPQATNQEVAARLAQASSNFLPRGPRGAVALEVRTDAQGNLEVDASIGAGLAGAAFKFSSDL